MTSRLRRNFHAALWQALVVVWPVLSGLLLMMAGLGLAVAALRTALDVPPHE